MVIFVSQALSAHQVFSMVRQTLNIAPPGTNMSWAFVGESMVVTFFTEGPVTDERLDEFVAECGKRKITHGFGTGVGRSQFNSVQRKRAAEIFKDLRTVMIQDDAIVRGIITALSWLGMNIKCFSWERLDDAIAYLAPPNVAPMELKKVVTELREAGLAVKKSEG